MTHDATELTESEVGSLEIVNDSVIKCFRRAMATTFLVVCIMQHCNIIWWVEGGQGLKGLNTIMVSFQNNNIDHQPAKATLLVSAEGECPDVRQNIIISNPDSVNVLNGIQSILPSIV